MHVLERLKLVRFINTSDSCLLEVMYRDIQRSKKDTYSGKFSNGANFRIIKTFENLFWTHVSKKRSRTGVDGSKMALYRFFTKQVPEVPSPYGSLSSSISPAAIKDANTAVKQCADLKLPQSQEERTPSLPLKTKQPLPSTPR